MYRISEKVSKFKYWRDIKKEKEDFLSVISYLAGDYDLEHSYVYSKIWYNG